MQSFFSGFKQVIALVYARSIDLAIALFICLIYWYCNFIEFAYARYLSIYKEWRIVMSQGAWQPSMNISTVLTSIRLLLSEPNPDDALMAEIVGSSDST